MNHKVIGGQTRIRLADGRWKTINISTFAGWYTPKFCKNVIDAFDEESIVQDLAEASAKPTKERCSPFFG